MPTIEKWLSEVGLEALAPRLTAEHVDLVTLGELTENDLRELGLTLGQRKALLRAVRDRPPSAGDAAAIAASERVARPLHRRPMTVMFCDIVGSTTLTERLDADDMLETLQRYRSHCSAAIGLHGGFVARFVGDGVFAYFGHPVAHESDAERAVRAALAIVDGIGNVPVPDLSRLKVRIAIATGMVVVGDLTTDGAVDRDSVVGATPNLAARLQALAPPDSVLVSATTYRLVEGFFRCEPLGVVTLPGITEPTPAWKVLSARAHVNRFRARTGGRALSPLVARDADLAWLREIWESARRGRGRVAVIVGEAGIGKSRLVDAFAATVRDEDARRIGFFASPFGASTPFEPLLRGLHRVAGGEAVDSLSAIRHRIARIASGSPVERQRAAAVLSGLLAPAELAASASSPLQRKAAIHDTLLQQFDALTLERPLLLTIDDVHWLDPSSLEFLARVVARAPGRRVLILATTRREPQQDWLMPPAAEILRLQRLGPDAARAMLSTLLGSGHDDAALVARVVARAEGVPLVLEEFARGMAPEAGAAAKGGATDQTLQIPDSLHESLIARLDETGPARQMVDAAAVITGSISRDLLARVAGLSTVAVASGLAALLAAGILRREGGVGEHYAFRHMLLRDAAYESLLREPRRELHARAAAALVEVHPGLVASRPETLARHLTLAGAPLAAAEAWLQAARRSLAQSALEEAVTELRQGLELLRDLPKSRANAERRLEIMGLLGPALFGLRGPGSREVEDLYAEAFDLCSAIPEAAGHFPIYWGWWRIARDFRVKRERADELLRRASERHDDGLLLQAHHCGWATCFSAGDLAGCGEHIDAGLAIYDAGDFRGHAALYGNHDARTCGLCERALVRWLGGAPDQAEADMRRARDWAATLDHVGTGFHLTDYTLALGYYRRDANEVLATAVALIERAEHHGFADHNARGAIFHGWARAVLGDAAGGAAAIESGLDRLQEIGTIEDFPLYHCMLAEAAAKAGRIEGALERITAAQAQLEASAVWIWMPEMWRWIGFLTQAAAASPSPAADAAFGRALTIAEAQQAHALALRATIDRARLWRDQGRVDEAAALLAAALGRPGDEFDQRAARALHEAIAGAGVAARGAVENSR